MGYLPGIDTLPSDPWSPGAAGTSTGALAGARFPAQHTERASLLLIHGFGEYYGRYARQIDFLTSCGITVYACDLPGHGHSRGTRGLVDVGELLYPVHAGLLKVQRAAREAGHPTLLFGHSMGGLLAMALALRVPGAVAGLFLSSPALAVGAGYPTWYKKLGGTLGRLVPAFPAATLDIDGGLSSVQAYVDDYRNDPLVYHGPVPARTAATMVRMSERIRHQAGALPMPTTIVHGDADTLADIAGSREAAARGSAVELVEFPGGRHELFNDVDSEKAYQALEEWGARSLV